MMQRLEKLEQTMTPPQRIQVIRMVVHSVNGVISDEPNRAEYGSEGGRKMLTRHADETREQFEARAVQAGGGKRIVMSWRDE